MNIDGEAGTSMSGYAEAEDIDHLRFDVTNIAYYLRSEGGACIIGVGGGRDIQSALLFGHDRVRGVEVNPIFIDLIQNEFREFVGIADRDEVDLVVDEARSHLSRVEDTYSVIQMSLIDTWAATGAGAFSLSENGLYTVEAWQMIIKRLARDGIFTVSRWHDPENIGETGRLLSLAVASLIRSGIESPSDHLALVTMDRISTLLLFRDAIGQADIDELTRVCGELQFNVEHVPGRSAENELLGEILAAKTEAELTAAVTGKNLNYTPPTDDNPYFFNMLKLSQLRNVLRPSLGVVRGNVFATLSLLALLFTLFIVTVATIVIPLGLRTRFGIDKSTEATTLWSGALYFALIGAGFMFVEIALIQRLTIFLGHPVYALGILLFTLIASAGVGSLLSEHLPLTRRPWLFVYPIVTAASIIVLRFVLTAVISDLITSAVMVKILVSVLLIFPMGMMMGLFFPTGMRLAKSVCAGETPWYWALNGILGVLCSALAVLFSIYVGISLNFYVATVCYLCVLIALYALSEAARRETY
jgi:hypothetical protein